MKTLRKLIVEHYNMADALGFEALKTIATKEDCKLLDKLIEDSWKVANGIHGNEESYHKQKKNIFVKYGFKFELGDLTE